MVVLQKKGGDVLQKSSRVGESVFPVPPVAGKVNMRKRAGGGHSKRCRLRGRKRWVYSPHGIENPVSIFAGVSCCKQGAEATVKVTF